MPSKPRYTGGVPTVAQIDEAVLTVMSDAAYDGETVEALAHQAAGLLAQKASPNAVLIEVHRVAERVERVRRLCDYLAIKAQAVMFRAGAGAITAYDLIPELRTGAIEWLAEHGGEDHVEFDQVDEDVLIGLLRRGSAGRIVYDKDLPHGGGYKLVDPPAQEAEPSPGIAALRQRTDQAERARQRVSPRPGGASTAQQIDAKLLEVLGRRRDASGPTWRGTATVVEEVLDELHGLGSRASVRARIDVLIDSGGAIKYGDSRDALRLVQPEYHGGAPSPEALDDAILGVLTSYLTAGSHWLTLEELYARVVARLALLVADGGGDVALDRETLSVRLDELDRTGRIEWSTFTGAVSLAPARATTSQPSRSQESARRLNTNLPGVTAKALDDLVSASGATQTEVIRRAVALLHRLAGEQARGVEVQLVDPRDPNRVRVIDVS